MPGLLLLHLLAIGLANDRMPWVESLFAVTVWGGAWFAGDRTRLRRERVEALQERALRAEHDAARERRLAASEERMRIARDLHDSAGHAINVILVHAGAARLNARRDLDAALTAIETIEEVARETVTEIDRIVGALREGDGEIDLPVGLDALDTLVERHRAAGLDVTLERRGDVGSLPRAVDRTAFRILQEALTNAAKHGDGHVDAELVRDDGRLEITVRNGLRSPVPQARPDHHGIVGMRERAGLLGGTLEAGAHDAHLHPAGHHPAGAEELVAQSHKLQTVRVLLVDDDDLMRVGLRGILSSDEGIEVVGEASDGAAALEAANRLLPHVVLMDVRMPGLDGIAATERLLALSDDVRVVILTTFEQDDYVFAALAAGASGFLLKRARPEELIAAVHAVAAGDFLLAPSVTRTVVERLSAQPAPDPQAHARIEELTPREREVLLALGRGQSNAEIAAGLFIEETTVRTHVRRILAKLRLRDRIHAVVFAYESGLIRAGED